MKHRFILYQRNNGKFYAEDTATKKQINLKIRDRAEAETLLHSKNEAFRQPVLNLQIARSYLSATDANAAKRTWQAPMDEMTATKTGETRVRYERAMRDVRISFDHKTRATDAPRNNKFKVFKEKNFAFILLTARTGLEILHQFNRMINFGWRY